MKKPTRSPLKSRSVRTPGESLRDHRIDLALDKVFLPLTVAILFSVIAFLEWFRFLLDRPPSPWVWTLIAACSITFAAVRVIRIVPKIKRLRQAEQGERAVGQYLERLREQGYRVFHDIIGDGFNVDHVLIGPAGVFTIETKTWSKPAKGEPKIHFDGHSIQVGGREPDRNPLIQARAQAGWLRSLLEESTGIRPVVRPVIVFPGWYIESKKPASSPVWVLNPKALPTFLANAPQVLAPDQVHMINLHLGRFIRNMEAERERQRQSPRSGRKLPKVNVDL